MNNIWNNFFLQAGFDSILAHNWTMHIKTFFDNGILIGNPRQTVCLEI